MVRPYYLRLSTRHGRGNGQRQQARKGRGRDRDMAIIGIKRLRYSVTNTEVARRFFADFGLRSTGGDAPGRFRLANGSEIDILPAGDPALASSQIVGEGVHEVCWGVDNEASLGALADNLGRDHALETV